ncbi:M24 family metallopeptidase [Pseudoalteromonas sp. T1lg65]|uniref:M24 family metallopeptidase n=1 Tax=Pseudoalteromonas sp. T1lg65 TaxID=2077101 RepID=UPI003F7ADFA7
MLTQVNYTARQAKITAKLLAQNLDAIIISGYENIVYLTGFTGHAATLLITANGSHSLITDYRYFERATEESQGVEVVLRARDSESLPDCIFRLLGNKQAIAFESEKVSYREFAALYESNHQTKLLPVYGWTEQLRMVKDQYEISQIKHAATIADEALSQTMPYIKEGISERDVAIELEYRMQKLGSEGISFDTILLFGERSSLPHGNPTNKKLKQGDLILLDFGAVVNGYRSDMTRTFVLGTANEKQQSIFDTVKAAQQNALSKVCAGADCLMINTAAHHVLATSPFAQYAGEGLGHGVGLFLHEQPFIKPGVEYQLQAGNVITIEPGIYIPQFGGVRLEEDILVTESGYECLTNFPHQFEILN